MPLGCQNAADAVLLIQQIQRHTSFFVSIAETHVGEAVICPAAECAEHINLRTTFFRKCADCERKIGVVLDRIMALHFYVRAVEITRENLRLNRIEIPDQKCRP